MGASHEMLEAWRIASKYGFENGPVVRVAKQEPVTISNKPEAMNSTISVQFRCWEFCKKRLYNRETGEFVAWAVFGRLHPNESDWRPLDDLPRYIVVGP